MDPGNGEGEGGGVLNRVMAELGRLGAFTSLEKKNPDARH